MINEHPETLKMLRALRPTGVLLLKDSSQCINPWCIRQVITGASSLSTFELNNAINAHIRKGNIQTARKLFDDNSHCRNVVSWNSIISGCIRYNRFPEAQNLFRQMPEKDHVTWNTMLSGFRNSNNPDDSYLCFLQMTRLNRKPNELTLSILISTFLRTKFIALTPQLHSFVFRSALNLNSFLGSALMRGYLDLKDQPSLCRVFHDISVKDIAPCNVLILGFMEFGLTQAAHRLFDSMPQKNGFSWSTLINGYVKNNMLPQARSVLEVMSPKDVVSWTAMIKGYVQWGKFLEALDLFVLMLYSETRPNHFTFSSVLDACAGCSSLLMGSQVHAFVLKSGIPLDVIVLTSFVDMYAKCGDIETAYRVFQLMPDKNLVSWNSIIGGYASHGLTLRALEEFESMVKELVRPDEVTFINVLSACGHGGMVEQGEMIFNSMITKYAMQPEMEHYACMVNLYGKAGQLDKANQLIKEMPFKPDVVVWGALLAACGLLSCLDLGEAAATGIYRLEHDHPVVYSTLCKMHGETGGWSSVIDIRKMIKRKHVRKQKAGSWVEYPTG